MQFTSLRRSPRRWFRRWRDKRLYIRARNLRRSTFSSADKPDRSSFDDRCCFSVLYCTGRMSERREIMNSQEGLQGTIQKVVYVFCSFYFVEILITIMSLATELLISLTGRYFLMILKYFPGNSLTETPITLAWISFRGRGVSFSGASGG